MVFSLFFFTLQFVVNKSKGRTSKRVFQESKARQIFRKTNIFYPLRGIKNRVSGGKKCSFFGKFGVLCFLETPVLRFTLLPYYRRITYKNCVLLTDLSIVRDNTLLQNSCELFFIWASGRYPNRR